MVYFTLISSDGLREPTVYTYLINVYIFIYAKKIEIQNKEREKRN